MSAAKRARLSDPPPSENLRVVINCGGTKFTTTKMTVERCAYLAGQLDWSRWEDDPTNEYFLDRDPALFEQLLRLMRQMPLVAGLLPRNDPSLFAALLAEADFLGFDALLTHVKAKTYYNCREVMDDLKETNWLPFLPDGWRELEGQAWQDARHAALKAVKAKRKKVRIAFSTKDDAYGVTQFDERYGSIADALASDVLPTCYENAPKASTRIVQVLPVESTTWLLIGDCNDASATVVEGADGNEGDDAMKPMCQMIQSPNLVRRVAFHALYENERGLRWMEPLIYVEPIDQQFWMDDLPARPPDNSIGISSRVENLGDPTLAEQTGGHARRMLRAQDFIDQIQQAYPFGRDKLWTHLLVQEVPPTEVEFRPAVFAVVPG